MRVCTILHAFSSAFVASNWHSGDGAMLHYFSCSLQPKQARCCLAQWLKFATMAERTLGCIVDSLTGDRFARQPKELPAEEG